MKPARIFENAGFLFAYGALARVLRIVISILIARHLGLGGFGILAFVNAYVEVFRMVADFGIETIVTRRLGTENDRERVVGSAAALKVVLSAAAYTVGLIAAAAAGYSDDMMGLLTVGLTAVFGSAFSSLLATPFHAALRARRIAWTGIVGAGMYGILAVAGVWADQAVLYFVLIGVLSELFGLAFLWGVFVRDAGMRWGGWRLAASIIHEALPVGALTLVVIGYGRFGMLLLERLHDAHAVGVYAIGLRVAELPLLLGAALAGSAYPALVRLVSTQDAEGLRVLFARLQRTVTASATVIALILTLFSAVILGIVGPDFVVAQPVLVVLAWAVVFMFSNQLSAALLLAAGRSPVVLAVACWNLVFNIGLNLALVPQFGAMGVAAALLVTEVVNTLIQGILVARQYRITPAVPAWSRTVAAGALSLALLGAGSITPLAVVVLVLFVIASMWSGDLSFVWILTGDASGKASADPGGRA
jgi:O-antigen/teichoic acid export membrane protein